MMKRDFSQWLNTMKTSIATWNYFTDFKKVYNKLNEYDSELNKINSLVGSKNIEKDFEDLLKNNPEILQTIPMLIAKREPKIEILDAEKEYKYNFDKINYDVSLYTKFMKETGIFDLLENHIISDIRDYILGIEVGMDTNARKNRTGHTMEDIVESFIIKAGFKKDITYFKEMNKSEVEKKFNIDLSKMSNDDKTEKRFDFVIWFNDEVYAIEVNFYSGGGSKLNETARSYKNITQESKKIDKFHFVWITDGIGWKSAKHNLEETFTELEYLFNINDLENGALEKLFYKG